ncbi:MAG: 50S ribosome-binding GTPase [Planctomycetota bacterium]|nr:50S ribosome-binding GTPase [Planctomycetota bacterium]
MSLAGRDTIAAIASPPGGAERAVLRLSGDASGGIVQRLLGLPAPPRERRVLEGRLDDGVGTQPCLAFWMPGPRSYTREDVAELHLVGSPPLVAAALDRVLALGARPAAPGEFTRRAFANGRIDLTRAEGVLGLIEAADRAAARSAAALLSGGLGTRVSQLRAGLDALRALCEASLDFDTNETGHVEVSALLARLAAIEDELGEALLWEQRREPARGRPRVVLAGRPNAGKSSLFNALVAGGDERALVSDLAGSTRDGVGARWLVSDVELELFDAPGFAELQEASADAVAQDLAAERRSGADVILWCLPAPELLARPGLWSDRDQLPASAELVVVLTKLDLVAGEEVAALVASASDLALGADVAATSASTASGLGDLAWTVAERLGLVAARTPGDGQGAAEPHAPVEVAAAAALGRELSARHRAALAAARDALATARLDLEAAAMGLPLDLVAETLRGATSALDGVTGETTPEDLLDRIFAGFCLGK